MATYRSQPYTFNKVLNGLKGDTGDAGKGIKSTTITYQVSTNGVTAPTGTWLTSIPSVGPSQYLWTRILITYTDNTTSTAYSVGLMGATGGSGPQGPQGPTGGTGPSGRGIKTTVVEYQVSSNGTTVPTGTWSTAIPSVGASQYLWTRTVITYTDNTTSTSYSIGMMGATGGTGGKGDKGDTGVGVKSIVPQYYLSSSATTQSGGSWNTAQPSWTPNRYIWTRSLITWDNNTTSTTTPVIATTLNDALGNIVSLDNTILAWCYNNNKTYINGSKIYAHSITSSQLSTDAIKSNNYVANSVGSFLNLADGSFDSKYLKWTKEGVLTATSGSIAGIKINSTSLTASQTSGSIVKGYEITNSGDISTYNTGSGRDFWLYLGADKMQLYSQGTYGGTSPASMSLYSSQISFESLGSQIGYVRATDNGMQLWGTGKVESLSNLYAPNIYAENVIVSGVTIITDKYNINNIVTMGQYQINEGWSYVNGPNTYLNGFMYVPVSTGGGIVLQIYVKYDGEMYRRVCWFGSWQKWSRMDNV